MPTPTATSPTTRAASPRKNAIPATDALAERIVAAALAEFTDYGLRRVTIDDIARRAGVHRVTVHKRFATRDDVIAAAITSWVQRYFTDVTRHVASLPLEDRLVEGFAYTMQTIRTDPLVARLLASEPETVLPYLLSGHALATVRVFFAGQIDDPDLPDPEGAAEIAARLGLSLLLTPESHFPLKTANDIRQFAKAHLAPLLQKP